MGPQPAVRIVPDHPKKPLVRRLMPDHSQRTRHIVQGIFVALNLFIGLQFYLWVRSFEGASPTFTVSRPAGAEGWLPIAGLMNLKYLLVTGHIPAIHPAAMFLFLAFVLISLLLKKAFCSWLCPVGTLSEFLAHLGRRIFGRNLLLPRWLDIPLRGLKYLLLAFFVFIIGSMSAAALDEFMQTPYGIIADVKMLNFFRHMGFTAVIVVGVLVLLSVVVENVWCRYLCPYGALMGVVSLGSPLRIRRDPSLCIDCTKCAKACPSMLPVDHLITIRSAECTGCLECVAACPAAGALCFSGLRAKRAPAWVVAAGIAALFVCICGYARLTGHWRTNLPSRTYFELIPHANDFTHP